MPNKKPKAGILGLGFYVPEKTLDNKDLENIVDTTDEWIKTRTGIENRYIAAENQSTLDLAIPACEKALDSSGVAPCDLDLIIVATVTPHMLFPATACLLQDYFGATKAAAFDLEIGCSGFIYGLIVATQFIENGTAKNILVVGSETLSKITDWEDRNTCVLFGDGAGAAVLGPVEKGGILSHDFGCDGSGGHFLDMPAGGSYLPASHKTVDDRLHYIKMDGNQVFKFAVRIMEQSVNTTLAKVGLTGGDIDLLVPHQANIRIIESSRRRLEVPEEKVYVNLAKYGNTSSASVPIAFAEAMEKNMLKTDDNIVLVGFGAGLSWGSVLIQWGL